MTYLKVLDTSKAGYIIKLRGKYTEMYRLHVDAPLLCLEVDKKHVSDQLLKDVKVQELTYV